MTVLITGVFDVVHVGHFRLFKRAAELGSLVVGLLTDELATDYKRPPIQTYEQRKASLEELPWVSEVVKKDIHDMRTIIERVEPDWIAVGTDWSMDDYYKLNSIDSEYLERKGIGLVFLPNERVMSTTRIIERARK